MRLNPRVLSSAAAIALTCMMSAAAYYYRSRNTEINEVMVFCKLQFNAHNCFNKLISYVEAAKKSVNVCMPSIQNPAIQARLVKLIKKKNIKVNIIIDRNGWNCSTEFFLKELLDAGAEIKCRLNGPHNMHHKFCLIDDMVLMTGTLNWGDDRSSDHWNYVYITSKPQLVQPVKTEFYQIWSTYMDIEQALETQPILNNSDDETPEIEAEDIVDTNESQEEPIQQPLEIPVLRETQLTPELCIM